MAFNALASDNFQRAAENPLSDGGNWSTVATSGSYPSLYIYSNTQKVLGTFASAWAVSIWTGLSWPNDQYSSITVGTVDGFVLANINYTVNVRMQSGAYSGYYFYINGTTTATLGYWSAGSSVTLYSFTLNTTPAVGDVYTLGVSGNVLTAYQNGAIVGTAYSTQYSSGYPGFGEDMTHTASGAVTYWEGGTVSNPNLIAPVQSLSGNYVSGYPTGTWAKNNTAGNLLIAVGCCRTAFTGTISDGANTWVPLWTGVNGGAASDSYFNVWYCLNCLGSISPRTVTFSTANTNNALMLAEFCGVSLYDQQTIAGSPTTTPFTSPALTANGQSSLYIGPFGCIGGSMGIGAGSQLVAQGIAGGQAYAELMCQVLQSKASKALSATGATGGAGFGAIATFLPNQGVPNSLMMVGCGT